MKKDSGQEIVAKLRQADVDLGKGLTGPEVCRKIAVISAFRRTTGSSGGRTAARCSN